MRAAEHAVVQARDQRRRARLVGRLGAEHPEHGRREQRGGRSLTRDVADDEAELARRKIDVVEEIASDRAAGHRCGRGREVRPVAVRLRQQRLLDCGGDLELLLQLRFVERFAVQARVLDGERRFGAERLERRPRRRGSERAPFPAVEVQNADRLVGPALVRALDVPHEAKRRAQDVADAERDGSRVQARQIAVEQILDDRLLAGGEHLLGNLAARLERAARQRYLAARAGHLELELPLVVRQHDEAALRPGHFDRGIEHEREHLVEDAARAERAQPLEQRCHLAQFGGGRHGAALD